MRKPSWWSGARRWLALALAVCGLRLSAATVVPGDDFNANTAAATYALQQWYNSQGRWRTTDWWNAANCIEAVENSILANNGQAHQEVLSYTFDQCRKDNFLNEFYDDEGWWALAWLRAYDLTGRPHYLDMARVIFADMTTGWDDHCDGGIWWKKDRKYKNAIANELFMLVAIRLHQRTPGDRGAGSFLDWAIRDWQWFKRSGMINANHLVNDGLNHNCQNNRRTTWTYNQGVILGALVELYRSTGETNYLQEAIAIADAATGTLIQTDGILCEPCEPDRCRGGDVPQFKGIFIRHFAQLFDETRKPEYFDFLFRNAHAVWFNNRDASNHFGLRWNGPLDVPDAARHSSAMMAVSALAEPVTALLPFAKGCGNPAFNHEVGAASGVRAWTCNATNASRVGFMQSGPFLASLPAGRHAVHFRLAVNSLSRSSTQLARLDIREENGGTILAARPILWAEFSRPHYAQDFALEFTNAVAGNPLEFRVHWEADTNAPALTITDVTVGGAHNWTAANLEHELGRLDGLNSWRADPLYDRAAGYLAKGPATHELIAGNHTAWFELKVDNFNRDNLPVATLLVVETDTGRLVKSRTVKRKDFANTLFHAFGLEFKARAARRYDFRTYWHYAPQAPRLTQRSVVVKRTQ